MNHKKQKHFLDIFFSLFDKYPREYFVAGFFVIFFFFIIVETFSYTVVNKSFYKELADKQQIEEVEIPVARGTIYSATNDGVGTVLATSVELNDLAIDPQIDGNKEELIKFLTDIVYGELCYLQDSQTCYDNLLKYLKVLEIPDYDQSEVYIKNML